MRSTSILGALAFLCSAVHGQKNSDIIIGPSVTFTLDPITIRTLITRTLIPINTCTNTLTLPGTTVTVPTTVTVIKTDTYTVLLPPVTVTTTTVLVRTAVVTATITSPCPSSTTGPCPDPCAVTKTHQECAIDRACTPTVSTTTTGCKCPVASCTSITVVTTCLTCPPLGTKTVPCDFATPKAKMF